MKLLEHKTLAEIVTDNYKAAKVLEKYNLDFCCKGKKTLENACSENSLDLTAILGELNLLNAGQTDILARFNQWPLDFLVDYIIKNHHEYVRTGTERLLFYTGKIARVHGGRHPELLKIADLFAAVADELENHMLKEETILFPYIRRLATAGIDQVINRQPFGSIEVPISSMEEEHESAGELLAQIKALSKSYQAPEDACNTYRVTYAELAEFERDLHIHIHLENNILFPKAKVLEASLLD